MAITMAQDITHKVLSQIFGYDSQQIKKVEYLTKTHAAKVTTGMFNFKIEIAGDCWQAILPAMITKYADHSDEVKSICKAKISDTIEEAMVWAATMLKGHDTPDTTMTFEKAEIPPPKETPAWMVNMPPTDAEVAAVNEAKKAAKKVSPEASNPITPDLEITAKKKKKPVDGVVPLKDSRAIGQKVNGTSGGSIYRCAAVGKVNVAVRIQNSSVSLRAEFQKARDEQVAQQMTAMGFSDHGKYLSMHLSMDPNVSPPMRVVGSVLLGAGVEFDEVATTLGQINA